MAVQVPQRRQKKGPPIQKESSDVSVKEKGKEVPIIEIDGSVLEGGGQILRNAVTLGCLLGKAIQVSNIRAGRSKPGLRPQHLTGIQLINEICGGTLSGDYVGSDNIVFIPGPLKAGRYIADTKTAGSICLLIQAILPCILFIQDSTQITLKGGTNADMAPPIDYLLKVFKPIISRFGVDFECILDKRGFYPKGGGQVTLISKPITSCIQAIDLINKGNIGTIEIEAFTAGAVPRKVGHGMCHGAERVLKKHFDSCISNVVHLTEKQATANGSGILVTCCTSEGCIFGGSGIGNRNEPPEETGNQAAEQFMNGITGNGCVDEYLQDQLIIFMALGAGMSQVRTGSLSMHTKTAIHVAEIMTGVHFEVEKMSEVDNIIRCRGIGYSCNK